MTSPVGRLAVVRPAGSGQLNTARVMVRSVCGLPLQRQSLQRATISLQRAGVTWWQCSGGIWPNGDHSLIIMAGDNAEVKSDASSGTAASESVIPVSLSDFPIYDGNSAPERFIQQCKRLAALGGILDDQLQTIIAARCRGPTLEVIEADGAAADVADRLRTAFGVKSSELALSRLSAAVKGNTLVLEYATLINPRPDGPLDFPRPAGGGVFEHPPPVYLGSCAL